MFYKGDFNKDNICGYWYILNRDVYKKYYLITFICKECLIEDIISYVWTGAKS